MISTSPSSTVPVRSSHPFGSGRGRRVTAALKRRNRLVESHRDLVQPLALHYARRCQEAREDLQQVGMLGLIRAAELYRRDLGTPFEAFARPHIRGAILHHLRDVAPTVRLPRRQAELQERLQRLEAGLNATPGSAASPSQLRRSLGIDEAHWQLLLRHRQLCRPIPLEEVREEELAAPEGRDGQERLIAIRDLLQQLDPRQKEVVQRVVLEGWSYRRLATRLQVSPMTVQRLLHRGLSDLRERVEDRRLRTDRPVRRGASGLRGY